MEEGHKSTLAGLLPDCWAGGVCLSTEETSRLSLSFDRHDL